MNDVIRAINYSLDGKSVIRRQVGNSMDVKTQDGVIKITIYSIEEEILPYGIPRYAVYGINEQKEYGLWKKESSINMSVEYELADLLTP